MAIISTNMLIRVLGDVSDATGKLALLEKQIQGMGKNFNSLVASSNNAITSAGTMAVNVGTGLMTVGSALTKYVTLPLGILGGLAVSTAIQFETAFAGVRKTIDEDLTGATTGAITSFSVLRQSIIDISNALGVSKEEIAKAMELAGQLGIRGNVALSNFTETITKLNITTGLSTEYLALMIGKLANIGGLNVEEDIAKIGAVITELGNKTATTEKDLIRFGVRLMAAGRLVGMTIPEVLGLAAAAEATGTKAERGGTAFTKILLAMKAEATGASTSVSEYTVEVAKNKRELAKWEKTLAEAIETQKNFTSSTPQSEMERVTATIATAQENIENYQESLGNLGTALNASTNKMGGFAKFIGISAQEFTNLMNSGGGATEVMKKFITKLAEVGKAGGDVQGILKDLGLSDARLIQAVLSLAQAELGVGEDMVKTTSAYTNAVELAVAAFKDSQGELLNAMDTETQKKLDTTASQFKILVELVKSIALLFGDDFNSRIKDFLKSMNLVIGKLYDTLSALPPETITKMVDGFLALLALGPGLTLLGGVVVGVGKAFQGLGILADFGLQAVGSVATGVSAMVGSALKKTGEVVAEQVGNVAVQTSVTQTLAQQTAEVVKDSAIGIMNVTTMNVANMNKGGSVGSGVDGKFQDKNGAWRDSSGKFTSAPVDAVDDVAQTAIVADAVSDTAGDVAQGAAGMTAGAVAGAVATEALDEAPQKLTFMQKIMEKLTATMLPFTKLWSGFAGSKGGAIAIGMITKFAGLVKTLALIVGGGVVVVAALALAFTTFFVLTNSGVEKVNDTFMGFFNFLTTLQAKIDAFILKITEGKMVETFAEKFGKIFTLVLEWFSALAPKIGEIIGSSVSILLKIGMDILGFLVQGFFDNLPLMIDIVIQFLKSIITTIGENMPMILSSLWNLLMKLGEGVQKAIPAILDGLWKVVLLALDLIFKIDWLSVIFYVVGGILYLAYSIAKGIWDWIVVQWDGLMAWLGKIFGGIITWILGIGGKIISSLWEGLKKKWEELVAWFKLVLDLAKLIPNPAKMLWNIGKDIVGGLWDGLASKWNDLKNWWSKSVQDLPEGIKKLFNIKSPSRVFRYIGQMTTEGLALGLEDGTKRIDQARSKVEDAVMINPDGTTSSFGTGGSSGMDEFIQSMVTAMKQAGLGTMTIDGKEVTKALSPSMALSVKRDKQW